ncbi:MAG: prepilin peptidase [Bacteriovoracaceae bacterium]|nr:prepilin peptidase [Bacteriovoracaceae bacterium]
MIGINIGSFINVLIIRIPKKMDVIYARSACPYCNHQICWYENIPLLSFIFLKGACSNCKSKISWQYPFVELITGIISILLLPRVFTLISIVDYFFLFTTACVFIIHFFIDIKHKILPNSLNLYLLAIFLFRSIYFYPISYWLTGALVGALFPFIVTSAYYYIKKQEGMGMGDIKLFGILGIHLGPFGIIHNIFLSCFLGSIIGLSLIARKKMNLNNHLAFGPYILVVATFQIFYPDLFNKYISSLLFHM